MTLPQSTTTTEPSLGRDLLYAARYYLGNRWVLVALGSFAAATGLYFGGWGWLVAAGLAPIVLSTLPCLVMCVFGVCAMCRSNKTQAATPALVAEPTQPPTALGVVKTSQPETEDSSSRQYSDRPKRSL